MWRVKHRGPSWRVEAGNGREGGRGAPRKFYQRIRLSVGNQIIVRSAEPGLARAVLVALQALLFRPVQRMCLYPLLFKQAVLATSLVERMASSAATPSS